MDSVAVVFEGLGWTFNVSPTAFTIFGMTVNWYGFIIAIGYAIAVVMGGMRAYKWRMSIDHMIDVCIFGTVAGIIGARTYYVLSEWGQYKDNFWAVFKIWEGGLAIYGGLIGALIAGYFVCRWRKLSIGNLLDLCGMSFLLAQGIGRWGNFFNQEAFGSNTTTGLFRMYSAKTNAYLTSVQDSLAAKGVTVYPDQPVHPTFLYESVWCLIGFVICRYVCNKHRKFRGQIFLMYGVWYGLGRAVIEGLRTDSLYLFGTNIRTSQLLSILIVIACAIGLIIGFRYAKTHPLEQEIRPKKKKGEKIDWNNEAPHAGGDTVEAEVEVGGASAIAVIGGEDGPTEIFVTDDAPGKNTGKAVRAKRPEPKPYVPEEAAEGEPMEAEITETMEPDPDPDAQDLEQAAQGEAMEAEIAETMEPDPAPEEAAEGPAGEDI